MAAIPILTFGVRATGSVNQGTFVNFAGVNATAGTRGAGVTRFDGASGDDLTVDSKGLVEITAGAAITVDQEFEIGAGGKAIPLNAGKSMGVARTAASGDGVTFDGLLI